MNILTGTQIKEADRFTMETEPIASLDLMERASGAVADWFKAHIGPRQWPVCWPRRATRAACFRPFHRMK